MILVVGEPGIGKSALVHGWTSVARDGMTVARGRCPAFGTGITYRPFAQILRDLLGLEPEDPDTAVLRRLGRRRILGITLGLDVAADLHPMAARHRFVEAWRDLLDDHSRTSPLVLVVEDLHWAEPPLVELLANLTRDCQGPLLILATARPEFTDPHPEAFDAGGRTSVLWLEPLDTPDLSRIAEVRLGGPVPDALLPTIERSDGNPFFLEELLEDLAERGALGMGGERSPAQVASNLPDSIRAVLTSRLEALAPGPRQMLQVASVVGRRFDLRAVESILGRPAPDIDELVRREFLRALPRGEYGGAEPFLFKHALTRDAVYRSLPLSDQIRLHAAYGEHLERTARHSDDRAAVLAHHFSAAVRPEGARLAWDDSPRTFELLEAKARAWSEEAARVAVGRYAIDEAIALLEQALACHPTPAEASRLLHQVGRANVLRYDGVGFWAAMEHAIDLASTAPERAAIYAELAFETTFRWAIWKRMPDRAQVDGWIGHALTLSEPGSRARAIGLVAHAYWNPLATGDAPLQAVAIAEHLGDPALLSYALDAHALTAFVRGDDAAAHERWARRAALADRIADLDHLEDLYGSAIAGNLALGRIAEARDYARLHDAVAMQLSPHHQVHAVAMHLELEELTGDWPRIAELTPRAEAAVAANLGTPCVRNERSLLSCSLAALQLGRETDARRLEAAADRLGMEGYESVFDPVRVRIALARDDPAAVREMLPLRMPPPTKNWWRLTTLVARLEALIALRDVAAVEAEAIPLLKPSTLLEPFAERALAIVRSDGDLMRRAVAHFEQLGIPMPPLSAGTPDAWRNR